MINEIEGHSDMDNNMGDNGELPARTFDPSASLPLAGSPAPSNSEYTLTDLECSDSVTCRRRKHLKSQGMSETGENKTLSMLEQINRTCIKQVV